MKRAPIRDILWLFFATRLMLILVTYCGYVLLTQDKYSSAPVSVVTLLAQWNQWDAIRYVSIAQFGYKPPFDMAFFPLFPLLSSALAHALGNGTTLLAAMLVSNAALLATLFVLYQLAVDSAGEQVARRTLLYLCIFPTAFFFFAAYNESLFLFFIISTFLALRRQRWWLAGLLGFLAALTRSTGVLMTIPFLYELWVARDTILTTRRNILTALATIALIPLGTLIYCFYCWKLTGNPLEFAAVQYHWSRYLAWPWLSPILGVVDLFWFQPFGSFNQVHILLDLSATLGFIVLAVLGYQKLRLSYTLWTAALLLSILLSPSIGQPDPLISNQRFVLEMFPAFITLATLGIRHPRFHQALLWIFPALLAVLSLLFVTNKWMV